MTNIIEDEKNKKYLTKLEIVFNRIFAVILFCSAPLILYWNILALPSVILFVVFSLFLFFLKKHHLAINFLFLLFALAVYFVPLPGFALFLDLRGYKFGGFAFNQAVALWLFARTIFVSLAVKNFFSGIVTFFKPSGHLRNLSYFICLIATVIVILGYPFLTDFKLREKAMEGGGNAKLSLILTKQEMTITEPGTSGHSTSLARKFFTAKYDQATKKYIYHLNLPYPLEESLEFTAIKVDGEEINFATDQRVKCLHCQINKKSPNSVIFPAGQDIDFIISSNEFIKKIDFIEFDNSIADFIFWK